MPRHANKKKARRGRKDNQLISFHYLFVINNKIDDCRYHVTQLPSETLENIDAFEKGFFRKYPFDEEPKSWMGSKVYLADPNLSNEKIAASATVEHMYPVEKSTTIEQLSKINVRIFGKGTTPLLVLKASAVPVELIEKEKSNKRNEKEGCNKKCMIECIDNLMVDCGDKSMVDDGNKSKVDCGDKPIAYGGDKSLVNGGDKSIVDGTNKLMVDDGDHKFIAEEGFN